LSLKQSTWREGGKRPLPRVGLDRGYNFFFF